MQPKSKGFAALFGGLLLAALLLAVLIGGCKRPVTPATNPTPARLHTGAVLRVACPDETSAAIVAQYGGKGWAPREGAQLEVLRYVRGAPPPEEADIWIIAPAELSRWASAGKLVSVPAFYVAKGGSYAWTQLLGYYQNPLLLWDAKAYALPLLGESPLCFYRADLFTDRNHQANFKEQYRRELAPPTTWEDYVDLAEFFSRQQGGATVLPPLPENDDDFDRLFYSVAAPYARQAVRKDIPEKEKPSAAEKFSFHYDSETGQMRIATPGFVHALQLLQRLQKLRAAGVHPEPPQAFADGDAVLCLADASWIERFKQGKVKDRFGVCRIPGSGSYFDFASGKRKPVAGGNWAPYLGANGWLAVVTAQSARPEAAFALLADLSGPGPSRQIIRQAKWGGGAYRHEHLDDSQSWRHFDLDETRTRVLFNSLVDTLSHLNLENPVLRLRTPDEREHMQALAAELRPALLEGNDAEQALAAVARRWQQLDEKKDSKVRRREYLLNLGIHAGP